MKVFIKIGPHPQYKEIVKYPPKGVKYEVEGGTNIQKYYSPLTAKQRDYARKIFHFFGLPRISLYKTDADLIFSTRGTLPITTKPWIVEFEHPYSFTWISYKNFGWRERKITSFFLSRKNCKRILPNSTAAYSALLNSFDTKSFREKIEILYLAIHYRKIRKIKHEKFRMLTITSGVYDRGFNIVKDIYPELKRKYDVEWVIKTVYPLKPEDEEFVKENGIKLIYGFLPQKKIDELYGSSDLFLYPSFVDTNAIVIYEAMRAGIPVITTDTFAFPDKVKPYYNGLMIHDPGVFWNKKFMQVIPVPDTSKYHNQAMSSELLSDIEYLIKNEKERKKMGKNAERMIKDGPLSVKVRNEKLKRIFEEALRR